MTTRTLTLQWITCGNPPQWCPLDTVNLDHPSLTGLEGVYVIWHGPPEPAVVRVGQGVIRDRLRAHRGDPQILKYAVRGLYVSWASVPSSSRGGVERYLAETLHPLVGVAFPAALPIAVNLPWE